MKKECIWGRRHEDLPFERLGIGTEHAFGEL